MLQLARVQATHWLVDVSNINGCEHIQVLPLIVNVAGHTHEAPLDEGTKGVSQLLQTLSVWQVVQNWAEQA